MRCRLPVAGKSEHIGDSPFLTHRFEFGLKSDGHRLPCGAPEVRNVVAVEPAFAVDAVERTDFAVFGHQVDAQRDAQPATVYGPEDGRRIDDGTHCKFLVRLLCNDAKV